MGSESRDVKKTLNDPKVDSKEISVQLSGRGYQGKAQVTDPKWERDLGLRVCLLFACIPSRRNLRAILRK